MTPQLRPATLADLEQITALEAELFPDTAWTREMLREELSSPHRRYLVLVDHPGTDSECVRGYGGLFFAGTTGDIQTVAVDAPLRGQGYGRKLMNALADAAVVERVTEMFLEVRADNEVARRLYQSLGFAEVGVRPRYYQPDDVDAIVMRALIAAPEDPETERGETE